MTDQRPIALITGATRGIGHAIAESLCDTHHLLIGGRSAEGAARVAGEFPSAEPFACELTDEAALTAAMAGLPRLDVLVHSAAIFTFGTVGELATEDWRSLMEVNLIAPATLTRLALPALRQSNGIIVFINAGAGLHAPANYAAYSASKYALVALADALRTEEKGGVRVTSIHPGRVATDMQQQLNESEGRPFDPEKYLTTAQVAEAVKLAVMLPPNASVEMLKIRPSR